LSGRYASKVKPGDGMVLYALATPVVFVFVFCLLALRTRVGYYRTTKLSVLLTDITVFAALGTIAWLWSIKAGK